MAFTLPSPSLPVPQAPPLPAVPKISLPKGPAPLKINTITGKGVPGGFTGTNKLIPKVAAAGVASNIAAIAAKVSSIKASIPGATAAQAKLAGLKAKALSKIKSLAKAPDLSSKLKLPAPP